MAWSEIAAIIGGLDASKSTTPEVKDVYLATDTNILYVCYTPGNWTDVTHACLLLAGGTMTGAINMGAKKITNLPAPAAANDAVRKAYADLFTLLTTFNDHSARHENGGADEVSVAGLSGLLADDQHVINAEAKAAAVQAGVITNGVTKAPTHDAVYDVALLAAAALPAGDKYTDADAVDAMGAIADDNPLHHDRAEEWGAAEHTAIGDDAPHHARYTDAEAVDAIEADDNLPVASITFIIDGGGATITTGQKGHLRIPFACTISRVTMLADREGSIQVDIWKDTYTNFPPIPEDSICAAALPTITTAQKSEDSTLTDWTTAITADDILAFNVESVTDIWRVTLSLKVTKT